jgi:hypothetical protein
LSQNPHLNLRVGQVKLHLEYILRKNIITSNSGSMRINTKSMSCQKGTNVLCTKIENKKYIKKVRKEMLNEESTHCVESLNDSLIDVHDNVHLFSKCDSKGKKRKK